MVRAIAMAAVCCALASCTNKSAEHPQEIAHIHQIDAGRQQQASGVTQSESGRETALRRLHCLDEVERQRQAAGFPDILSCNNETKSVQNGASAARAAAEYESRTRPLVDDWKAKTECSGDLEFAQWVRRDIDYCIEKIYNEESIRERRMSWEKEMKKNLSNICWNNDSVYRTEAECLNKSSIKCGNNICRFEIQIYDGATLETKPKLSVYVADCSSMLINNGGTWVPFPSGSIADILCR